MSAFKGGVVFIIFLNDIPAGICGGMFVEVADLDEPFRGFCFLVEPSLFDVLFGPVSKAKQYCVKVGSLGLITVFSY